MVDERIPGKIPGIKKILKTPPSPLVIGTVAVLAVAVLVGSGFLHISSRGSGIGGGYVTLNQLMNDYDVSRHKFRSYEPGDIVLVKDIVKTSKYEGPYTRLQFYYETSYFQGYLSLYVMGNVEVYYRAGTRVIFEAQIGTSPFNGYDDIIISISQDQIRRT